MSALSCYVDFLIVESTRSGRAIAMIDKPITGILRFRGADETNTTRCHVARRHRPMT